MLKCPPPTETAPVVRRRDSCTSAIVVGVWIAHTGTGFRPVTSLTMSDGAFMRRPGSPRRARGGPLHSDSHPPCPEGGRAPETTRAGRGEAGRRAGAKAPTSHGRGAARPPLQPAPRASSGSNDRRGAYNGTAVSPAPRRRRLARWTALFWLGVGGPCFAHLTRSPRRGFESVRSPGWTSGAPRRTRVERQVRRLKSAGGIAEALT